MPKITLRESPADCLAKAFPSLTEEERGALERLALVLQFDADELIAQEGSHCSGVYGLCQGLLNIGRYAPKAHEKRALRFLAPGEWCGLEAFFLGCELVSFQYARTIVVSTLLFFLTARFRAFLQHHPQALFDLCRRVRP